MSATIKTLLFAMYLTSCSATPATGEDLGVNSKDIVADPSVAFFTEPSATRIVGGSISTPGDYPYFVEMGGCGGALIAPDTILTAGHCGDRRGFQVHIGAYNMSIIAEGSHVRFCEDWVIHPLYETTYAGHLKNDFALCKLNEPVYIDTSFVSLELNEDETLPEVGDDLIVMGHGTLTLGGNQPDVLYNVTVPYISTDTCNQKGYYDKGITGSMLCAGYQGKDSCQGDSGGPLVKRSYQGDGTFIDTHVGVVSWGYGCGGKKKPGVYARTSKRASWIKSATCDRFNSVAPFCSNSPTPVPSNTPPCEQDLRVRVKTDDFTGGALGSLLSRKDNSTIDWRRIYLIKEYQNEHQVCLESDVCYQYRLVDLEGDGIKDGGYELILNGELIKSGDGDFGYEAKETFCTIRPDLDPSSSPSSPPSPAIVSSSSPSSPPSPATTITPVPCTDDPDFRYKNKETHNCDYFLRNNKKKRIRKKCRRMWDGKKVKDWCPATCGEKGGIGKCKDLFNQSDEQ